MKVSTQTRYAIRMLLELSLHDDGTLRLTAQQIAQNQRISEKYLESIATKLQKGGFLISSKGFGGGYQLARPPEEISLGDVMRLMESNFFSSHCMKNADKDCDNFDKCITYEYLCEIEMAINEAANAISIDTLRERYLKKADDAGLCDECDKKILP